MKTTTTTTRGKSSRRRSKKTTNSQRAFLMKRHVAEEEDETDNYETDNESLVVGGGEIRNDYYSDYDDADDDDNYSVIIDNDDDDNETQPGISTTDLVEESKMQVDFCEMTVQEMNQIMEWWSSNAWMEGDVDNQATVAPHNSLLQLDSKEEDDEGYEQKEREERQEEEEESTVLMSDESNSSFLSCEPFVETCALSEEVPEGPLLPFAKKLDSQNKSMVSESLETFGNSEVSRGGNLEPMHDASENDSIDILLGVRNNSKPVPSNPPLSDGFITNLGDLQLPPPPPQVINDRVASNLLIDQPHPTDVPYFSPFQSANFWNDDDDKFITPPTRSSRPFKSMINQGLEDLPNFFRGAFSTPQKKVTSGLITSMSGSDNDDDDDIPDFSLRSYNSALDITSPEELHHSVRVQHDEIRRLLFQTRDMADQVAALTESSGTEEDDEKEDGTPLLGDAGGGMLRDISEGSSDDDFYSNLEKPPISPLFSTPPSQLPLPRRSSALRRRRRNKNISITTKNAVVDSPLLNHQESSPSVGDVTTPKKNNSVASGGIAQLSLRWQDHIRLWFFRQAMKMETTLVSRVLVPVLPLPLLLYVLHRPKQLRQLMLSILLSITVFLPLFVWWVFPRRMSITEAPLPSLELFLQQPYYTRNLQYHLPPAEDVGSYSSYASSSVLLTVEGDQDFGLL